MTQIPTQAPPASDGRTAEFWRSHTQISLQPVAAPSILGLYGFAAATFMVAANVAGWYGTPATPLVLFPFAMVVGGVAQFMAGMWSYRARDGLASAMHGVWGSFWIGFGIYWLLVAVRVLPAAAVSRQAELGLGYWFIVLAAITWVGALAAMARSITLTLTLAVLAAGSTLLAIGWTVPNASVAKAAGDVLVASAVLAFYTASALLLEGVFMRSVLPAGPLRTHLHPGPQSEPIEYRFGEPGVRAGQ